jgi:polyhydroxyalkanoate synthase
MLFDPYGISATFLRLQQAWLNHPRDWRAVQHECIADAWMLQLDTWTRLVGGQPLPSARVAHGDDRFTDREWHGNSFNAVLLQYYLTSTRFLEKTLYDTPGASRKDRRRAAFWARQWFNALAPSNFLMTNPVALRKAWNSAGGSLLRGLGSVTEDMMARDLQMVDGKPFKLGENVADTAGSVVFRNAFMEVIQYQPLREQVHAIPIVLVPPWINKYYILDLNRRKSMVRHLLSEGFSVFTISWKNPGAEAADSTFEQYMLDGVLAAIQTARTICSVPQVHAVGYCIGGTALATLMAWLNRRGSDAGEMPVAHWSLLASPADFSRPGEIDAFINEESLTTLDTEMAKRGYLDKSQISWSFRLLRPNSLVWHYYTHKYLYGEAAPVFDVLAWNADGTRIPRALHNFCLREFYMDNKLAQKNKLMIGGLPMDLGRVRQPLYAVGASEDHIVPWRGAFKTTQLVGGPVRFVLSTSGHILGIVNPPGKDSPRKYWAGDVTGTIDGKAWRADQTQQAGSWWSDWIPWLRERCGPLQTPPPIGHETYPVLGDAPGTYVRET